MMKLLHPRIFGLLSSVSLVSLMSVASVHAEDEPSMLAMAFEEIQDTSSYTVTFSAAYFPSDPPDKDSESEDEKFELYKRIKWQSEAFLGDYWRFDVGLNATMSSYAGAEKGFFTAPGSKQAQGRFVDFEKLSMTRLGDTTDLVIGKSIFSHSVSEVVNITDIITNSNGSASPQPHDEGVWQARLDYYLDEGSIHVTAAPMNTAAASPQGQSRFLGSSGLPPTLNTGTTLNDDLETDLEVIHQPNLYPHDWQIEAGYKNTWDNWDYFANVYHGRSPYVTVVKDTSTVNPLATTQTIQTLYPDAYIVSAGAVGVDEEFKYYAEGLYQDTVDNDLDEDFLHGVIGMQYTEVALAEAVGLETIKLTLEVAADKTVQRMHADYGRTNSSKDNRHNDMNYVLGLEFTVNSDLVFGYLLNHSAEEEEYNQAGFLRYLWDDNTTLRLSANQFEGGNGTAYEEIENNDYFEFMLERKF